MIKVNALGDACPIPVVKTKNAINTLNGLGVVETMVDNEIAVQNLEKMANQKGYGVKSEKIKDNEYKVTITVGDAKVEEDNSPIVCIPCGDKNMVVAISSSFMGVGDDTLGKVLMKGFIYALSQQDKLPNTILFYNGGAKITCEDSPSIEDLEYMKSKGVEILTCGTCLNHYGLSDKLKVGSVTNMYDIVEKMTKADVLVKP
ncbi:MAG: sulfurtransferase-like selenium metabolism protein YedF [Lachnospirales bacterium]